MHESKEIAPQALLAAGLMTLEWLDISPNAQQWKRSGEGSGSIEVSFPEDPRWEKGDVVLMRVSGDSEKRVLVYNRDEWAAFLSGARNGEFDVDAIETSGTGLPAGPGGGTDVAPETPR